MVNPTPAPLLTLVLQDTAGLEVLATITSDQPHQLILSRGVTTLRLPAGEADRLWRWQQSWDEGVPLPQGRVAASRADLEAVIDRVVGKAFEAGWRSDNAPRARAQALEIARMALLAMLAPGDA